MNSKLEDIEVISKKNDRYVLRLGDKKVEIEYSKNNKTFNECMVNILKQKFKK